MTNLLIEKLKISLLNWESGCHAGRAQSDDVREELKNAQQLFKQIGYEFCAHNAAILGSKRYAKYKIPSIDVMITESEFQKINSFAK
jgi:hypothetical protein